MPLNVWPTNAGYPQIMTSESVSGVKAAQIDTSGKLRVAMAAVSGRMPAAGIVVDDVASGILASLWSYGLVQFPSAGSGQAVDFSGALGSRIWVGPSGHLVTSVGGGWTKTSSGAWLSGTNMQALGVVVNSGGALLNVSPLVTSGSISSGGNLAGAGVL